jgi:predicted ribonuclease YlaK
LRTLRADRAATAIKHLQKRISGLTDAPVPLRSGVTLEIARVPQIDTDAYVPPIWADAEILDTCDAVAIFASSPVTLVTGDYGMKLRASARDIRTLVMPDEYRIPRPSA